MTRQTDHPSASTLDRLGSRMFGGAVRQARLESTEAHGGLFPRDDEDMSSARLESIAERMYR